MTDVQAHSPWWNTAAYQTLVANKWDIIVVMLGTNDAAPTAQGYWPASNHKVRRQRSLFPMLEQSVSNVRAVCY